MKRVLVFGTFDILHKGHLFFMQKAKSLGDTLVVSVARDDFVQKHKGHPPMHNQQERLKRVLECEYVDQAFLGDKETGSYLLIKQIHPDIICLGYDQSALGNNLQAWITARDLNLQIIVLDPYKPHKYKSSILKRAKNFKHHSLTD